MLSPHSCDLFQRPFFQFAQMKQYQPAAIEPTKAAYRAAWRQWQSLILQVSAQLGAPFAPPHIECWCNGWQVRAHFFAYFKYQQHQQDAAIFSILLNRRRLSISLDWHRHRAHQSLLTLAQYRQWPAALDASAYADWSMWRDSDGEYADHPTVATQLAHDLALADDDFFCIGRHIERNDLAQTDSLVAITETIRALQPLYEACWQR